MNFIRFYHLPLVKIVKVKYIPSETLREGTRLTKRIEKIEK